MSTVDLPLALSPEGRLHVDAAAATPDVATPEGAGQLVRAFGLGDGHGLFLLGAAQPEATLAPGLAFWRDVGRLFVRRCARFRTSRGCALG